MSKQLIVAMGMMLLVAAACNESKDNGDADGPVTDEEFRFAAQSLADGALLTSSDLPQGWVAEAREPEDDIEGTPSGLSEECARLWEGINEFDTLTPDASARSDDFGSSSTSETISTDVDIFRDEALASTGEQVADTAYSTCTDAFEGAIIELTNADFASEGEAARIGALDIVEARNQDLVDFAFKLLLAVRYDVEGQSIDAMVTTTFLRSGRVNGTYTHVSFDRASPDVVQQLLEKFAERLEEADARLPE